MLSIFVLRKLLKVLKNKMQVYIVTYYFKTAVEVVYVL
jgi:hypothetical protein